MSSRRRSASRRSTREWLIRGVVAVAIGGFSAFGIVRTTAYAVRTGNVDLAHAMAPGDGRITALQAETLLRDHPSARSLKRVEQLAREALRQDPTAVSAATSLGVIVQARGEQAAARRLLAYSQTLSRRDLQTQIWAIETATAKGDVPGALRHYDIALRTSRHAADLLFPILGSAIAEPTIRSALVRVIARKPPWSTFFLDHIAGNTPDPEAVAALYAATARAGVNASDGARAAVIDTLVARSRPDDAWNFYRTFRHNARRDRSRDQRFNALLDTPTPFDWTPVNDVGINASIQRTNRGGVLDFAVSSGIAGAIVQQRQLLPPGRYALSGHSIDLDVTDDARPFWTLFCPDGQGHGAINVSNSSVAQGRFAGMIDVPPDCKVQTLALIARPTSKLGGTTGQIDLLELYPASEGRSQRP
jgi:hypothetical protein